MVFGGQLLGRLRRTRLLGEAVRFMMVGGIATAVAFVLFNGLVHGFFMGNLFMASKFGQLVSSSMQIHVRDHPWYSSAACTSHRWRSRSVAQQLPHGTNLLQRANDQAACHRSTFDLMPNQRKVVLTRQRAALFVPPPPPDCHQSCEKRRSQVLLH